MFYLFSILLSYIVTATYVLRTYKENPVGFTKTKFIIALPLLNTRLRLASLLSVSASLTRGEVIDRRHDQHSRLVLYPLLFTSSALADCRISVIFEYRVSPDSRLVRLTVSVTRLLTDFLIYLSYRILYIHIHYPIF